MANKITVKKVTIFPWMNLQALLFGGAIDPNKKVIRAYCIDSEGNDFKAEIGYDMEKKQYHQLDDRRYHDPMNPDLVNPYQMDDFGCQFFEQVEKKLAEHDYTTVSA